METWSNEAGKEAPFGAPFGLACWRRVPNSPLEVLGSIHWQDRGAELVLQPRRAD